VAIQFDFTVSGENANTYVSIPYADQYFENMGGSFFTTWVSIAEDDKKRALIRGTQYIDSAMVFIGEKLTDTQSLEFPRYGLPYNVPSGSDADPNYIPRKVLDATLEASKKSIGSLENGVTTFVDLAPDKTRAVIKEKIDTLEVEYDKDSLVYDVSYSTIKNLLRDYLQSNGLAGFIPIGRA